jgi:hypothetical protein
MDLEPARDRCGTPLLDAAVLCHRCGHRGALSLPGAGLRTVARQVGADGLRR